MRTFLRVGVVAAGVCVFTGCPSGSEETPSGDDAGTEASVPPPGSCGRNSTPCPTGGACEGAPDCTSGACKDGVCQEVIPPNGNQDGDETDVDCGGSKSPACADGKKCKVASDCTSTICKDGVCAAPSPTDGVKNGTETGVDCGGPGAPKCPVGEGCASNADCDNVKCDDTKKCAPASNNDGVKNGTETDIDCGGANAPKCDVGKACNVDADCNNVKCNTGTKKCDPPSATDGLKNGSETDIDCGGGAPTNAAKCAEDRTCATDNDCATTFCSTLLKCVAARSCKATIGGAATTSGITTCGRYEVNNAAKQHESCCRSLPLPNVAGVRLDKYEVTAGRFRQFVESVGPNIRKWVNDEIATNPQTKAGAALATDIPVNLRNFLPASANPGDPLNLVIQIGTGVMDTREPSTSQGCYNDDAAYGANAYWWPAATLAAHFAGHPPRKFTQQQYDEKSMNCAPYWMYAAFCAWDGGRLPTTAEMNDAWGTATYPWGASYLVLPDQVVNYETTANYFNTHPQGYFYGFPDYGTAQDLIGLIAAPGRFIADKTTRTGAGQSWMDLGANVMEVTRFNTGPGQQGNPQFCDFSLGGTGDVANGCPNGSTFRGNGMQTTVWVGGSWEGHQQFSLTTQPFFTTASYNLRVHTQYGKTGVRCAR